jgi:transglutaminase-like putative cysteine protease
MKGLKDGSFKIEFDLEQGKTYEFRYVIGAEKWVNDEEADAYVPNNIDGDNSVVHC